MATTNYKMQRLYLRVSTGTLSFAVYHPFGGKPPVVENYEVNPTASLNVNLKEALSSLPLAQENFSRAEILLNVPYSLKPIELFNEEEAADIYHQCFHESQHDRVFYDVAGNLGAALVYGMSEAFCRVIDDNFQTAHFSSTTTAVANRFAEAARGVRNGVTYVYSHENLLDIFAFRNGRLLLGNRFATRGIEDAAYYVMLAVKTLQLNAEEDEFHVVEQGKTNGALTARLADFLVKVNRVDLKKAFAHIPLANAEDVPYDMMAFLVQPY